MKRAGWSRDHFARACADGPLFGVLAVRTLGWVLTDERGRRLWCLHRALGRWDLTHAPTGLLVPGSFETLATGKDFAEALAAEVNCAVGRFGVLKGTRGARAFRAAVNRRCVAFGFDPVRPATDRVVYDDKGASKFYPETRP